MSKAIYEHTVERFWNDDLNVLFIESPALSCLYSMALLRNQIRPDNKWICEGGQVDSTGVP